MGGTEHRSGTSGAAQEQDYYLNGGYQAEQNKGISYTPLANATGFDASMIEEFIKMGSVAGADRLRGARLRKQIGNDGGTYWGYLDQSGANIDSIVSSFTTWAGQTSTARKDWKSYVDLKTDRPGRGQTLLMPEQSAAVPNLLNAGSSKKTLLGG